MTAIGYQHPAAFHVLFFLSITMLCLCVLASGGCIIARRLFVSMCLKQCANEARVSPSSIWPDQLCHSLAQFSLQQRQYPTPSTPLTCLKILQRYRVLLTDSCLKWLLQTYGTIYFTC